MSQETKLIEKVFCIPYFIINFRKKNTLNVKNYNENKSKHEKQKKTTFCIVKINEIKRYFYFYFCKYMKETRSD